ncbi:MAG: flagellar basal body-associated FliL family protein [Pelosinus sp.]|nr:flagellar basal body-associated FliL family protein [Pelosinus sp.]
MAEDEKKEKQEKKFPLMLIVGMVVFGLVLAGGISYFIATKIVADKGNGGAVQTTKHDPGQMIKMGDAKDGLVINVGGVNSGRFLKMGLILEVRPDKNAAPAEGKGASPDEIKMQDVVLHVLRAQKVEDFDPAKQEQLKEMIKSEVNKALGSDRIYDVYITSFVLQ